MTGLRASNFRNFEPQTGKTGLDSHCATIKFSIKQYRREGNDVLSDNDIEKGTFKMLRGTHVYGVVINRKEEPESAKTLKGISEYSDFEYVYHGSTFSSIKCSFQTSLEVHREIKRETIVAHWKEDGRGNVETGVISNFDLSKESEVTELMETDSRKKKGEKAERRNEGETGHNKSEIGVNIQVTNCPDCGKFF